MLVKFVCCVCINLVNVEALRYYVLNGLLRALYCLLIWKARSSVCDDVMVSAKLVGWAVITSSLRGSGS